MKIMHHLLIKSCVQVTNGDSSMRDLFTWVNPVVELYIFCNV